MNCNKSIDNFTNWYDTQMNCDENTLQVIIEFLEDGQMHWIINQEKVQFNIEINKKQIANEVINSHCCRALLMINPAEQEEKDLHREKQIYEFVKIIRLC